MGTHSGAYIYIYSNTKVRTVPAVTTTQNKFEQRPKPSLEKEDIKNINNPPCIAVPLN